MGDHFVVAVDTVAIGLLVAWLGTSGLAHYTTVAHVETLTAEATYSGLGMRAAISVPDAPFGKRQVSDASFHLCRVVVGGDSRDFVAQEGFLVAADPTQSLIPALVVTELGRPLGVPSAGLLEHHVAPKFAFLDVISAGHLELDVDLEVAFLDVVSADHWQLDVALG